METRWGATPGEWGHLDLWCGLTEDLLPVVSNPNAEISEYSSMGLKGKTPSLYNRVGKVAGLKDWPNRRTTPAQIAKWQEESDYGICVQTRTVRALDVDVSDVRHSERLVAAFLSALGLRSLSTRRRAGTGKQLLPFVVTGTGGELRKRSFKVEGGLVEFLATGQQFVAIGAHFDGKGEPTGTRYEWIDGLPAAFPTIPLADFERAWAAVYAEFGIEPERRSRGRAGTGQYGDAKDDEVASWLEANWETYWSDGKKLFILCPWKGGHSSHSGETESAWLLAGTSGYARGHFSCLHAGCSGRSDSDFLKAVGMPTTDKADFEPGAVAESADGDALALHPKAVEGSPEAGQEVSPGVRATASQPLGRLVPGFERNKQGGILTTLGNVVTALQHVQMTGHTLRYDTFRGELVIVEEGSGEWRPFKDADAVTLRIALARHNQWGKGKQIGKELMRDALTKVAADNEFDSAVHWLTEIVPKWDGVERIARLFPDYFRTDDTLYTQACGVYVMTAHAGRIMEPGCQADMAPILIGPQGLRKSSGVAAISPDSMFFKKFDLLTGLSLRGDPV